MPALPILFGGGGSGGGGGGGGGGEAAADGTDEASSSRILGEVLRDRGALSAATTITSFADVIRKKRISQRALVLPPTSAEEGRAWGRSEEEKKRLDAASRVVIPRRWGFDWEKEAA